MIGQGSRRLLRMIGWLLTPVAAWAASFLGGWLGAVIGQGAGDPDTGLVWLGVGAVLGALAGVVGWVILLRWYGTRVRRGGE